MKSSDVCRALAKTYCHPEWAILFEVPNATGARHSRIADAVAMSVWPSRGLHVHGMEIKVTRYDWLKNEKQNPAKAEEFYNRCDFFWVVTPEGIINDGELPPTWGHIIVTEKLTTRIKVHAPVNPAPKPLDRSFLAALMRAMQKQGEVRAKGIMKEKVDGMETEIAARVQIEVDRRSPDAYNNLLKKWQDLLVSMGFKEDDFRYHSDMADVGKAYRILQKAGLGGMYNDIKFTLQRMDDSAKTLRKGLEHFDIEGVDPIKLAIKAHTGKL